MSRHILRCQACGNYTLNEACKCGGRAVQVRPPKYSPKDQYGEYRRKAKQEQWKAKGWL